MPPPNGGVRRGCLAYLSVSCSARQGRKCGVTFSLAVDGGKRAAFDALARSDGLLALPRGSPVRTAEAASSKLPPQARGQPNRARDAARRGPVAPRSLGGRRRGRRQRASTVSTSATSARRRPGTAPRPEAARARASNSDVLQGEASITSRRRHRVARPALNRGRRRVHALAHLRHGASSPPRARATSNGSGGSVPGRQESRTFFDGHGRLRRGDHRRGRGSDDAFRNHRGSQSVASE